MPIVVMAAGLALGACGKDEPATTADTAAADSPQAAAPAATPETVVADSVQAMSAEDLREAAAVVIRSTLADEGGPHHPSPTTLVPGSPVTRDRQPGATGFVGGRA